MKEAARVVEKEGEKEEEKGEEKEEAWAEEDLAVVDLVDSAAGTEEVDLVVEEDSAGKEAGSAAAMVRPNRF